MVFSNIKIMATKYKLTDDQIMMEIVGYMEMLVYMVMLWCLKMLI